MKRLKPREGKHWGHGRVERTGFLWVWPWALATRPVTLKSAIDTVNSNQYFVLELELHLLSVWQTQFGFNISVYPWASIVAQLVKNPAAMWETWVQFLHWEDPLEKGMATHSSILAWRIPWSRMRLPLSLLLLFGKHIILEVERLAGSSQEPGCNPGNSAEDKGEPGLSTGCGLPVGEHSPSKKKPLFTKTWGFAPVVIGPLFYPLPSPPHLLDSVDTGPSSWPCSFVSAGRGLGLFSPQKLQGVMFNSIRHSTTSDLNVSWVLWAHPPFPVLNSQSDLHFWSGVDQSIWSTSLTWLGFKKMRLESKIIESFSFLLGFSDLLLRIPHVLSPVAWRILAWGRKVYWKKENGSLWWIGLRLTKHLKMFVKLLINVWKLQLSCCSPKQWVKLLGNCVKHLTCTDSFHLHNPTVMTMALPTLQVRKLRHRVVL